MIKDGILSVATGKRIGIIVGAALQAIIADSYGEPITPTSAQQRVIPVSTVQRVVTGAAGQYIVPAIANEEVIEPVAGPIQVGYAHEREILHMAAHRIGHETLDRINPLTPRFGDGIADLIDYVDVISDATGHGIDSLPTI